MSKAKKLAKFLASQCGEGITLSMDGADFDYARGLSEEKPKRRTRHNSKFLDKVTARLNKEGFDVVVQRFHFATKEKRGEPGFHYLVTNSATTLDNINTIGALRKRPNSVELSAVMHK